MKGIRELVVVVLGAAAIAGCNEVQNRRPVEQPRVSRTEAAASAGGRRERPQPTDEKRLSAFGLEVFWDSYIRDETISKLQFEGDETNGSIYAFTESNRLYQVDVQSGKVNWVFEVGRPLSFTDHQKPIAEFNYPKTDDGTKRYDEVYFIAKDTLFALDKADGIELWRQQLKFGPASPPQATPSHVLVGAWDRRVYAFKKDDPTTYDWSWVTGGDVTARPAQDSPTAFVASTDGTLYTFDAVKGEPIATFHTDKPLTADLLVYKDLLYMGGEDYNFYALRKDGGQEFRYGTGAPIKKQPIAIANPTEKVAGGTAKSWTIYAVTDGPDGGCFAFLRSGRAAGRAAEGGTSRTTSHEFLWKRDGAEQVLARGRDVVYLLEPGVRGDTSRMKRVVKVDAKSCYVRDEVKYNGVDYYLTNTCDPNNRKNIAGGIVFAGFRNGWIIAYKEKSPYAE
ncbi:PQQ-binding-like beta-propeller repeat protein [bacterium]|nr:PQQ-binding-like beta-propeller repeat protein [bacterium]